VRPARREGCGIWDARSVLQLPLALPLEGGAVDSVSFGDRAGVGGINRGMPAGPTRVPEATIMERAVGILLGILAGLCAGLVAVILGTVVCSTPPDAPDGCVAPMVAPPAVGALCGGWVAWQLRRSRQPERLRRRQGKLTAL